MNESGSCFSALFEQAPCFPGTHRLQIFVLFPHLAQKSNLAQINWLPTCSKTSLLEYFPHCRISVTSNSIQTDAHKVACALGCPRIHLNHVTEVLI